MGMTRQILMELVFLSLSGTALGLLLWLLRPLTRRLFSWKWHYYLWLAVLLRLALPVHVDMGWEILPARESGVSAVSELPEAGGRAFVDAQISGEQVSGEQASGEQSSIEQSSTEQFSTENLAEAEETGQAQRNAAGTLSESARSFEWEALWQWGFLIWLAGAAASLAVRGLRCRRFLRYIKEDCRRVSEDRLQHLAGRLAEELRIPGWVWVYESPRTATPALIGLRRSFIVLPQAEWELKEAELVLRHELIHLKRKDLWYKALFQLVCCIHWFNPVLILFERRMEQDCELSCDEAVIAPLREEERKVYGNVLLDTAERQSLFRRGGFSAALLEGRGHLGQRLHGILSFRERGKAAALLSIAAFAGIAFLSACAPSAGQETDRAEEIAKAEAAEEGNSDSFLGRLADRLFRNSWQREVLNMDFGIDPSEDAWKVFEDDELLAGKDVDGVWKAFWYMGDYGDGVRTVGAESFAICGSESILIAYAQEPVEVELRSSWDLVSGDFKLVYVSPEGRVETLADQGEEAAVTVQLEPGRNVIRMAGREAILEKLSISVEGLDADKISQVYMTEEEENEPVYK